MNAYRQNFTPEPEQHEARDTYLNEGHDVPLLVICLIAIIAALAFGAPLPGVNQ